MGDFRKWKISDMPGGSYFEFFCKSFYEPPSPCGVVSNQKEGEIRKSYFPKGKNKFFAIILVFIIFSLIFYFFKNSSTSKLQKTKRVKRHVTVNVLNENHEDNIQILKEDVEIVPEQGRTHQYVNHRYAEEKIQEEPVNSWFTKQLQSKTNEYPDNIQDVILKSKESDQPVKVQNGFLNEMFKDSGSMRLKGVYKQLGLLGNQLDENYRYSKEINNLMQTGNSVKGWKRLRKNTLKGRGAPFQLPNRGESLKRQKSNTPLNENLKRLPITIYLDFYPMAFEKFKRKKLNPNTSTPPESNSSDAAAESANIMKFLPPGRKQSGMIMKLNLYPKESQKDPRKPSGGSNLKYNEKAERKSFGWFSKHKKKNQRKECSCGGLNPNEKHITAKWKNEKGEWIHAKHVTVKYLKKENESNKR